MNIGWVSTLHVYMCEGRVTESFQGFSYLFCFASILYLLQQKSKSDVMSVILGSRYLFILGLFKTSFVLRVLHYCID